MVKPFSKTNTGVEFPGILSPNVIKLILTGNAWGIKNQILRETFIIVIAIKHNHSGK